MAVLGCECGKRRFTTERAALRALKEILNNKHRRETTPCRAYECHLCGGHHLTHHELYDKNIRIIQNKAFEKYLEQL